MFTLVTNEATSSCCGRPSANCTCDGKPPKKRKATPTADAGAIDWVAVSNAAVASDHEGDDDEDNDLLPQPEALVSNATDEVLNYRGGKATDDDMIPPVINWAAETRRQRGQVESDGGRGDDSATADGDMIPPTINWAAESKSQRGNRG